MKILSIETSCDETAVSVLEAQGKETDATFHVLGNALYSQAKKHAAYGGVYPSLAKREHALNLVPLLKQALKEASLFSETTQNVPKEKKEELTKILKREAEFAEGLVTKVQSIEKPPIDIIAVTQGPGLEPALWVGINVARALSCLWGIPIIPVNHLEGHMIASTVAQEKTDSDVYKVSEIPFPALGLIVSGGHTEFVFTETWGSYTVVGSTRDDSIGEAFDKVARILGLPYPGGPEISRLAEKGRKYLSTRPVHLTTKIKTLPRPMLQSGDLDFSFSGIKTAVLYLVRNLGDMDDTQRMLVATEFEEAVIEVLIKKTVKALEMHPAKTFILGGGVSANSYLRKKLDTLFSTELKDCTLRLPADGLSTDNAVMIGMAGYFMHLRNSKTLTAQEDLPASGHLDFSTS